MTEQWTKWEPVAGLSSTYDLESILDDFKKLKILLVEAKNLHKIEITFNNAIRAYRITDEALWLKGFNILHEQYGSQFYVGWTFFKITNSIYMHDLLKNSLTLNNKTDFTHFVIFTSELFIEVITSDQPHIKFIV